MRTAALRSQKLEESLGKGTNQPLWGGAGTEQAGLAEIKFTRITLIVIRKPRAMLLL